MNKRWHEVSVNHLMLTDFEDGVLFDENKETTRTTFASILYKSIGGA